MTEVEEKENYRLVEYDGSYCFYEKGRYEDKQVIHNKDELIDVLMTKLNFLVESKVLIDIETAEVAQDLMASSSRDVVDEKALGKLSFALHLARGK